MGINQKEYSETLEAVARIIVNTKIKARNVGVIYIFLMISAVCCVLPLCFIPLLALLVFVGVEITLCLLRIMHTMKAKGQIKPKLIELIENENRTKYYGRGIQFIGIIRKENNRQVFEIQVTTIVQNPMMTPGMPMPVGQMGIPPGMIMISPHQMNMMMMMNPGLSPEMINLQMMSNAQNAPPQPTPYYKSNENIQPSAPEYQVQ